MRTPQRSWRTASVSVSVATLLALTALGGCKQVEEMMGKKDDEASKEESKEEESKEAADGGEETKEAAAPVEDPAKLDPEPIPEESVEAVPVEDMHTGLDLMLQMIPAEEDGYFIARDATVLAAYADEALRFADGPLATLAADPMAAGSPEMKEVTDGVAMVKPKIEEVKQALDSSGLNLKAGAAIVKNKSGDMTMIFNADSPEAVAKLVTTLGGKPDGDLKCKAIEGIEGFNVCTENQAQLDAYKPREDPAELRQSLSDGIPGVELEDVNLLAHFHEDGEYFMAVSTIPGSIHLAIAAVEKNDEIKKMEEAIAPAEAKILSEVDPGAGFIWASLAPKTMTEAMASMGGAPAPVAAFGGALDGQFLLAGSVDPGGILMTLGMTDTSTWEPIHAMAMSEQKKATTELNKMVKDELGGLGGAKVVFEEKPVQMGGAEVKTLHVGLTDLPEGEILKAYTGLHLDLWTFAANGGFTVAFGPDEAGIAKLGEGGASGPSAELLASLPQPLADGLGRNEVSFIVHSPMDFLHGKQMHELIKGAAVAVPDLKPESVYAALGLLAPISSGTMWVAQPAGKPPVFHLAVQGIGNQETEEGKLALTAAHTVADGGDPEEAFKNLASHYSSSPMAYAYKARSGTDGPGYLIGSGTGAVIAAAAVAVPLALGQRNDHLADDLGVKAEDPAPEVKPVEAPKPVKTKKVPKKDPKKDPKKEDPKATPKRDDPKKDPVVEPRRPLPPTPTEDPKATPRKKGFGKHVTK